MIWLVAAAVAGSVLLAILVWWARRRLVLVTIDGLSMEPTLRNGDRVLVYRPRRVTPRRHQVIVLEPLPNTAIAKGQGAALHSEHRFVAKRVAAISGDLWPALQFDNGHSRVPQGTVVVLGDNRDSSFDSRHYGVVPVGRVLGVVTFRLRGTRSVVKD